MNKDNLIEFAKEQCEIFPEDSAMGEYLRETLKKLQAEHCEDAISKASVFEIVGNLMSIPYDLDRRITEKDVSESMDEIRVLPPVTPTQNWIPTSERQPEENGNYLAFYRSGDENAALEFVMVDHCNAGGGWLHEVNGKKFYKKVLAWMPLPKPYKESEEA